MKESIEYQHTLLTLRGIIKGYPGATVRDSFYSFDVETIRALGSGTSFVFESLDDFKAARLDVEKQAKGFWLHPDSLRFLEDVITIFVRRPNCHNCGEVYAEHASFKGQDGKCLFLSTNYSDNYAPLLKAVDRA